MCYVTLLYHLVMAIDLAISAIESAISAIDLAIS
jgi:hypothetical protein